MCPPRFDRNNPRQKPHQEPAHPVGDQGRDGEAKTAIPRRRQAHAIACAGAKGAACSRKKDEFHGLCVSDLERFGQTQLLGGMLEGVGRRRLKVEITAIGVRQMQSARVQR